jgi:hypothetical protein
MLCGIEHKIVGKYKKGFAAKLDEAKIPAKSGTKNLKSSNPKRSLLGAGRRGVWKEFRPVSKFWAKSIRFYERSQQIK